MRVLALLICAGVACATPPAHRTEAQAPRPRPPAPPPSYPPALADEIIKAQLASWGTVTGAFGPVSADLMSGDDRLVAAALEVVETIGTRVDEMAKRCPPQQGFALCGLSNLDALVGDITGTLILLRRKAGCANVLAVERAAKQFDRLPRFQHNPKADLDSALIPDVSPDNSLPIRVFFCGMNAVKDKVAACFAQYQVPGTVMLNVVVGRNGAVRTVVATGQFAGTPAGACAEDAARTATFPPSDGLSAPYPFVLKPAAPVPEGHLDDLLANPAVSRRSRPPAPREGDLSKQVLVETMNSIRGKVAECYARYQVPGTAIVNVTIDRQGVVTVATVTGKFADTPTGECVSNAVKTLTFPPSNGLSTPYPFLLRSTVNAVPEEQAPAHADRIVEAQRATGGRSVTPLFDAVRDDLESDDGVRVLRGLRVVDEIGVLVTRGRSSYGEMAELRYGADHLEPLADMIEGLLDRLQKAGPCATAVEVRQSDAQFRTVPRSRGPAPPPRRSAAGALPKRVLSCGMVAVQSEVAACFDRYKVPGIVMVNVVIARSGKVSAAIAKGAFAGTPTGACVEGAVKTAVFPPSDGIVILYPFALK